jgi:CRP-like cAMP-binding protein
LSKGEIFGEQALIYEHGTRTATVTAKGPVECLSLSQEDLAAVLGSALQHVIYRNSMRIALEKSATLKVLTTDQIEMICRSMDVRQFQASQVVVKQGEAGGSGLWIVLKGSLSSEQENYDTFSCIGDRYI